MKTSDFSYTLPHELIARYPVEQRTDSRLLCLNRQTGALAHRHFHELPQLLRPEDLLVFNNSRVIPARLFGAKQTGGKVEVLVERILPEHQALAHVRASRAPKIGARLIFEAHMPNMPVVDVVAEVVGRQEDLFVLQFLQVDSVLEVLEHIGHIPLPPYIARSDELQDKERYQTVYADPKGSVAAPTAGLHFDDALLQQLRDKGVDMAFLTLHVGAGTFQPVRVEDVHAHHMHAEYITVSQDLCDQVRATKARGGRVIAVGTTSVRALETAARSGEIQPFEGDTDIFIYPGVPFHCVDAMITNFHLPESTLLMLVSAFASREQILHAYQEAIAHRYRFFSYGDAMFVY